jgi:hypothetical protein
MKVGASIKEEPKVWPIVGQYLWHTLTGGIMGGGDGFLGMFSLKTYYDFKSDVIVDKTKEVFDLTSDASYADRLGEVFHHSVRTAVGLGLIFKGYFEALNSAYNGLVTDNMGGNERIVAVAPLFILAATNILIPLCIRKHDDGEIYVFGKCINVPPKPDYNAD